MAYTPLSKDISNLLVANSIGLAGGVADWAIYIGVQPDKPDKCITIYDLDSQYEGRVLNTGETLLKLAVQIILRGTDYVETVQKFAAINAVTDAVFSYTGTARSYGGISRQQEFLALGKDEKNRYLFSGDFLVTLK